MEAPFGFCARLMFRMDGATLEDFFDLVDERVNSYEQSRFKPYIERLDPISKRFFQRDFFSRAYVATRNSIKARLYSVVMSHEFMQMFSTPIRKFDMFQAMQQRKIVLVDTQMSMLGTDNSTLFGRYIIAQTLNAAYERFAVPKEQWNPAYLIIDEFPMFADDIKTPEMLRLAREYNLGITVALQDIHGKPFTETLRNAISVNTSIKYASSPEGTDLNYASRDLRCETDFLRQQTKTATDAHFACFVRGLTEHPMALTFPFGAIEREPQMTEEAHQTLVERNRAALAYSEDDHVPYRRAEPEQQPPPLKDLSKPVARDDDDDHTKPATDWG